jgi:hypothetical protein
MQYKLHPNLGVYAIFCYHSIPPSHPAVLPSHPGACYMSKPPFTTLMQYELHPNLGVHALFLLPLEQNACMNIKRAQVVIGLPSSMPK